MKSSAGALRSEAFCTSSNIRERALFSKGLVTWMRIANSGFSIPYAVLGFTGKAFGKVSFADKSWESNSLPIGNGSLGGNILGSVAAERITLNEKTLWRGGPNTEKGADYYWNVNKESAHPRLLRER